MASNTKSTAHFLIVDDEKAARRGMANMLRRMGHNVTLATSGKHAITKVLVPSMSYNGVFMDVRMPGLFDGITAAERIFEIDENIPVLFITAYAESPEENFHGRVSQTRLNILGHLDKPIIGKRKDLFLEYVNKLAYGNGTGGGGVPIENPSTDKEEVISELETVLFSDFSDSAIENTLLNIVNQYGLDNILEAFVNLDIDDQKQIRKLTFHLNLIAFQIMKKDLYNRLGSTYVAFLDGRFIMSNEDRLDLVKKVVDEFGRSDILIMRLEQDIMPKVKLRRPRRVI